MAGYEYQGPQRQAPGINHGTASGYRQHSKKRVPPCDDCREAYAEYKRGLYWRSRGRDVPKAKRQMNIPARCGTPGGYRAHRARGEEACLLCRSAHSEYEMERYRARRAGLPQLKASPDTGHGTQGGYAKHLRVGTVPCRPCMDAHAAWANEYVKTRRAAS